MIANRKKSKQKKTAAELMQFVRAESCRLITVKQRLQPGQRQQQSSCAPCLVFAVPGCRRFHRANDRETRELCATDFNRNN